MRSLLFWLLFPLLIPQALYVRRTAPRFTRASGHSEGVTGQGHTARLLAIGDSIIAGVGATTLQKALVGQTARALAQECQCRVEWTAVGESGYKARQILDSLLPQVTGKPYDFIIISVGVNDITGLTSVHRWRRNINSILGGLFAHSPKAVIAFAGMPPMHLFPLFPEPLRAVIGLRARTIDRATVTLLERHSEVVHVPVNFDAEPAKFSGDGYHPSEESYAEFGWHMAQALISARHNPSI